MRKISSYTVMALCLILCVCPVNMLLGEQETKNGVFIVNETFDSKESVVKNLKLTLTAGREVSDGVLKITDNTSRSMGFTIGDSNWRDYEVEFRIKRLEINPKDQHFGLKVRSDNDSYLMFYCRGKSIIYQESANKKEIRHTLLGELGQEMDTGENARWYAFRISVKGNEARVYVDNVLIGALPSVVLQKGKVSFYVYNLNAMLDDFKVTVFSLADDNVGEIKPSVNILSNSSFEFCTLDGLPDYWGCLHWGILDPYWVVNFEEWCSNYRTDDTVFFDGKRSMKVTNPFDKPDGSGLCLRSCCLGTAAKKEYTLSAYMKGDYQGMKVSFAGNEITLTDSWQRYQVPFVNPGGSFYKDMINIYPKCKGTFWVDAVQLEEGNAMSPYAQSVKDSIMTLSSGVNGNENIEVPKTEPKRIEDKIVLDGILNETAWKDAGNLDLSLVNGTSPSEKTRASVVYDRTGIFIGIVCQDEKAGSNRCTETKRDGNVWSDPAIEIFVDPKLSRTYYYHLAFNQQGVQYDAFCNDLSWDGLWQVATRTADNSWSAEVFIPFGDMGIDKTVSDWWGINICRENHNKSENSSWSPTYGGFHTPERFGRMKFDKETLSGYYFDCEAAGFRFLSPDTASLCLRMVNDSHNRGVFLLNVSSKNTTGEPVCFEEKLDFSKERTREITSGAFRGKQGEKHALRISLLTPDKRQVLYSTDRYLAFPSPLEVRPQYELYSGEDNMLVKVTSNLSEDVLRNSRLILEITNFESRVVRSKEISTLLPETDVELSLTGLPLGDYSLKADLRCKNKPVPVNVSEKFKKAEVRPNEVRIDRIRRVVVVDGRPFIPLGFAWEGELTPNILTYLKQNGCNAVSAYVHFDQKDVVSRFISVLDSAAELGMKVKVGCSGREKEKAKALIEQLKDHPAVLAWDIFDEVFTEKWGRENYQFIEDSCRELKELDPYHPVYINENQWGLTYLKGKNLDFPGDIVSIDYYAWPPSGNIPITGDYVATLREMGREEGKPAWVYLLGSGYAFWASREFTPSEQELSTYLAVVNGATAIFYWACHPKSKSDWETIKRLMSEITQLTPVLSSTVDIAGATCTVPAVKMLVKKYEGVSYLIAVNTSTEPVDVKFNIPVASAGRDATVLFEKRTARFLNGVLEDTFAGYQRHVYRID